MANPSPSQFRMREAGDQPVARGEARLLRGQRLRALGTAFLWYCVIVLTFAPFLYYHPYRAHEGQTARQTIVAPIDFSIVDEPATKHRRDELYRNRPQIWIRDSTIESGALQRLQQFLSLMEGLDPDTPADLRTLTGQAYSQLDIAIDMNTAGQFMTSRLLSLKPPLTRRELRRDLELAITEIYSSRQIVDNKVGYRASHGQRVLFVENERGMLAGKAPDPDLVLWWPQDVRAYLAGTVLPRLFAGNDAEHVALRQALLDLMMSILGPNLNFNPQRTEENYRNALIELEAQPVVKRFVTGEVIVQQGDSIGPLHVAALDYLDSERHKNMSVKMVGILLFVGVMFLAVGAYLRRFRSGTPLDARTITLHVLPPLLALIVGWTLVLFGLDKRMVMLSFPSVVVGMLASLLIAPQVAFILVLVSSLTFAMISGQGLDFLVYTLFAGFSAVLSSRQLRAREEVLGVGLRVGLVNIAALTILELLGEQRAPEAGHLLVGFVCAVLYAPFTHLLLLIFERLFNIVTDLKLLELTGLQNRAIRLLEEKAPGSYQHVLNVTKLAEAAANAIGANYLLVRAGAYFHDIGKMVKPKYFSENQTSLDDKRAHSRLSPYMSVLIIKNHVKEGIELARQFDLPQRVIDFIPEHHGTSLIRYFYSQALKRYEESEAVDPVREEDFRYPGPRPRSIETAIVMLADSVEAIAASKFTGGQVNESELRRVVQQAISEKFNDGQFDECNLTLAHLHQIREAFVKTLAARYHFRIAYPTLTPRREGAPPTPVANREAAPISVAGPAA